MHERLLNYQETMEKLAVDPKVAFTITAIRQPLEELSNNIIKLLLKQIEKPTKDNASHVVLPSVIKARKSSERKSNNLLPIGRNN